MDKQAPSGGVFNIGSQQGNINNIAGDMNVAGNVHNEASIPAAQIAEELENLRNAISVSSLPSPVTAQVMQHLDAAEEQLRAPNPDAGKVAKRVERIAEILKGSGALVGAAFSVLNPLNGIVTLLGPFGSALGAILKR